MERLDEIDIQILDTLQHAGRTRRNELAEKTGLSLPSASERIRKLEERHIITGYHAVVDHTKLGYDVTAFIAVTVDSSKHYASFIERAERHKEILEVHAVTGDGSHLLKVRTRSTSTLEKLLGQLQSWQGVIATRTNIVLSSPKETMTVSLKHYSE